MNSKEYKIATKRMEEILKILTETGKLSKSQHSELG